MLFDVRVLPVGDWSVLCVVGDLDLATVPRLRQELDRLGSDRSAVDLTAVDYLDPLSLGVLLVGALRARRAGGRFVVVCPPGAARDLLAETGVERILRVVEDRAALD